MDELLRHCVREISFDGDLGCNVSRLHTFVQTFYESQHRHHQQTIDAAFSSFLFSLVIHHPTVQVGIIPEDTDVNSEVWIAPQVSAKRKASAKGEEHVVAVPPTLGVIPDAQDKTLEELQAQYGDALRVAVNPDAILAAITGSHVRPQKLTPMVYSALQVITRGREDGVSVVELGQKTGYDQKTCFYLVKQLTELDLVVKVRRGGIGTNYCIHRHFYDRSPSWKAIREEEKKQAEPPVVEEDDVPGHDVDLEFTTIDARHLSSLPLIKGRLIQLLKASKDHVHASMNILLRLGFRNPTRTDRRFFNSRMRELMQMGVIERVVVPSNSKKSQKGATVTCFRLVDENANGPVTEGTKEEDPDEDFSQGEIGVKMNRTLYRQILELLDNAQGSGMTLSELADSLAQFDRRTIELLLARAEREVVPSNLSDLGLVCVMETSGRERRNRYYTTFHYQAQCAKENLTENVSNIIDLTQTGGFMDVAEEEVYGSETELKKHLENLASGAKPSKGKPKRESKKRKAVELEDGEEPVAKKQRRVKADTETTSVAKKRGRPRKNPAETEEGEAEATVISAPKKRGRPRKHPLPDDDVDPAISAQKSQGKARKLRGPRVEAEESDSEALSAPKKKAKIADERHTEGGIVPRTRGRARKEQQVEQAEEDVIGAVPVDETATAALAPKESGTSDEQTSEAQADRPETIIEPTLVSAPAPRRSSRKLHPSEVESEPPPADLESDRLMSDPVGEHLQIDPALQESEPPNAQAHIEVDPATAPTVSLQPTGTGKRVNVSHLRRENEVLRIITSFGGIANCHVKDFFDAHAQLLQALVSEGELTSAPPNTRIDKKTLNNTLNSLESRGKVKLLKTIIPSFGGATRPTLLAHLPDISEEALQTFLANLSRSPSMPGLQVSAISDLPKLDHPVDYGKVPKSQVKTPLPLQLLKADKASEGTSVEERWAKNSGRAEQLWTYDDDVIREVLLNERTTANQLYGGIIPRVLRAKELHLQALGALETRSTSAHIVSHDERILHIAHFSNDITLAQYLRTLAPTRYSASLTEYCERSENTEILVKDLPQAIHSELQIGRAKHRSKILDVLSMLAALGITIPLQPTAASNSAFLVCPVNGEHPTAFDQVSNGSWTSSAPQGAPVYWKMQTSATILHWASAAAQPPMWCVVSTTTISDAQRYWELLKRACLDHTLGAAPPGASGTVVVGEQVPALTIPARSLLRRRSSWDSGYVLSWYQIQYLKRWVDYASATTPLDDQDEGQDRIQRFAYVIGASTNGVEEFYSSIRAQLTREIEKSRARTKKRKAAKDAEVQAQIAKRAAEAKKKREQDWDDLAAEVLTSPLTDAATARIKRVKEQYLRSNAAPKRDDFKAKIESALREAAAAANKVLKKRLPPRNKPIVPSMHIITNAPGELPPIALNPPEKPVAELIANQGPPITPKKKVKRKRGEKKEEPEEAPKVRAITRRHRFQWTREYDELARDASVIIKARARNGARLDWAALEQVFPAIPRNTVRQRAVFLRDSSGGEAYMNRLEDQWYGLWVAHRGTAALPDHDPASVTNFDLISHLEFLRKHIDKNALRIGYSRAHVAAEVILPGSLEEIYAEYEVIDAPPITTPFDFNWSSTVEEGREKKMMATTFTIQPETISEAADLPSDIVCLAESALKMVFGTPQEHYDPDRGAALLQDIGQEFVTTATENLLSRGVVSKLVRDITKPKPGRHLKISEPNQNLLGGTLGQDLIQDANSIEEAPQDEWRDWPLLASEGDIAALVQMTSEHKVAFLIDTSNPQAVRTAIDWNSKKADDDDIECHVQVYVPTFDETEPAAEKVDGREGMQDVITALQHHPTAHGHGIHGNTAACQLRTAGIIDCTACLDAQFALIAPTLSPDEAEIIHRVLSLVGRLGPDGASKDQLIMETSRPIWQLYPVLARLSKAPIPLLYWTGYSSVHLVSAAHMHPWTVITSEAPLTRMAPRRWLDISGRKMFDIWEAGIRAVTAMVLFRPGISQAELIWRLRVVYDRTEVNDLLQVLHANGTLSWKCSVQRPDLAKLDVNEVLTLDGSDGHRVFWFVYHGKRWYYL